MLLDAPLVVIPLSNSDKTDYLFLSLGVLNLSMGTKNAKENYSLIKLALKDLAIVYGYTLDEAPTHVILS